MKKRKHIFTLLLMFTLCLVFGARAEAGSARRYIIYVNRRTNIINVVDKSTGKLARSMYCSTGRNYATIRGTFNTVSKMRWHQLQGGVYGQYCTRIHGSYLFHSAYYYSTNKTRLCVREYNKLGSQASAGCVRLAVVDAKWIYDHCSVGTTVVIGESRELKKPTRDKLRITTGRSMGWDPTDPDPANPYYPTIKLKKSAVKTLEYGSKITRNKLKRMIKVSSRTCSGKQLLKNVRVKGKINTSKPGKYKVTYTVTDPRTLLQKSITVTFRVKKAPEAEETTETTAAEVG